MNLERLLIVTPVVIVFTASSARSAGPPENLLGKSVVVSWSNTRQQREERPDGSWGYFHTVQGNHKLMIYISAAGRVFTRQVNSTRAGSGNIDQVGRERSGPYPTFTTTFSAQTITVISESKGRATRTRINFDSGFTSCAAQTIAGFEAGKTGIMMSPIIHRKVETRSVATGAASCTLQAGNVFGSS